MNDSILQEIEDLFTGFYADNMPRFRKRFEYWFEDEQAFFIEDHYYYDRILNSFWGCV